jgi:hypothetical protein
MSTPARGSDRWRWTDLGKRMGYTSEPSQRDAIHAAIDRMVWTPHLADVPYLDEAAVQPMIRGSFGRRRPLTRAAAAQLNGAQLLLGLEDRCGERVYLQLCGCEAAYLLAEHVPARRRHADVA